MIALINKSVTSLIGNARISSTKKGKVRNVHILERVNCFLEETALLSLSNEEVGKVTISDTARCRCDRMTVREVTEVGFDIYLSMTKQKETRVSESLTKSFQESTCYNS